VTRCSTGHHDTRPINDETDGCRLCPATWPAPKRAGWTFNDVAKALLDNAWVFAKTMPHAPHWYTLRNRWKGPVPFEAVVQFIRDHGYKERYGRSWYDRLDVNDMKYWSMGAPLSETTLINRAVRDVAEPYDGIAATYDALWSGPAALAENEAAARALNYTGGDILDVGCGTGLLLDLIRPAGHYMGIDPSQGMLTKLLQNHPGSDVVASKFERFYTDRKFDVVVSLFGSPSYAPPKAWERLPDLLAPGGRYFLMFFSPDYVPVTHLHMADVPDHAGADALAFLPGAKVSTLGNFTIAQSA